MENKILTFLLPHLDHGGYYILFGITFLETSALLGLLAPGESMVVIAGLLASRGVLEIKTVIWVAALGAIVGDSMGYFIGSRFGEAFLLKYGKYFFIEKAHLDEAKAFFARHGGKTVFLCRFMVWLRVFGPVVAGISRMHYWRFLVFNVAGGIAWATTFSLLGYFAGNGWDVISRYLGSMGFFAGASGVIAVCLYYLFAGERRRVRGKSGWLEGRLSSQMPQTWGFIKARFRAGNWYGLSLTMGILLFFLGIVSFAGIVEDVVDRETLFYLDFRIQGIIEGMISPGVTRFMADMTNFGGFYFVAFLAGAMSSYLLYRRRWGELLTFFLAAGWGEMILSFFKLFFHRARPLHQVVEAQGYSFPSGHAFFAVIVFGYLIFLTARYVGSRMMRMAIYSLSVLFVILIGISRIYLNVHWLTDVLGGYAMGLAWLAFCIIVIKTISHMAKRDSKE